jgi:hypothetical protein
MQHSRQLPANKLVRVIYVPGYLAGVVCQLSGFMTNGDEAHKMKIDGIRFFDGVHDY